MKISKYKSKNYKKPKADFWITQNKYDELKVKLTEIIKVIRPELIKEAQRTAENGDFSDNAEYKIAKGKLRGMNNRILRIKDQLKYANIIKPQNNEVVQIGHTVTIQIEGKEKTYQILGSTETDPSNGIISHNSPLGLALLNKRVNDKFEIKIGIKNKKCTIIDIKCDLK